MDVIDKSYTVDSIIVTYNRLELLKECIEAVKSQSYPVRHIYVIDNNSTDSTWKYLKKIHNIFPTIIPVHLPTNLGGSGGFNQGLKIFMEKSTSDYVWIMDDDTIPTKNALVNLVKQVSNVSNLGFFASNVRWKDGTPAKMNIPKPTSVWNNNVNGGLIGIDYASFVSILIPREVIKKVGFPITDFFIWGDDVEYTLRITKHNYNGYFICDSLVEHKIKNNIATDILNEVDKNRIKRYFYANRNAIYNEKKYGSKTSLMTTIIHKTIVEPWKILIHTKKYKLLRLKISLKGTYWGFFFNPKIDEYNSMTTKRKKL